MKRVLPTLFLAAAMAACVAVPAFARDLVIPAAPLANAPPPIADEGQARAAMSLQGVRNINGVAQVGDYWEGQGLAERSARSRPISSATAPLRPSRRQRCRASCGSRPNCLNRLPIVFTR